MDASLVAQVAMATISDAPYSLATPTKFLMTILVFSRVSASMAPCAYRLWPMRTVSLSW